MCRRLIFLSVLGCVVLMSSCSSPPPDPDDNDNGGGDDDVARSAFDGCWGWYEDGSRVYDIIIEGGQIASMQNAGTSARQIRSVSKHCSVDSTEGLIALSYALPVNRDGFMEFVTLRFDLPDSSGARSRQSLESGVLAGKKFVEDVDPEDIYLFPPREIQAGELVKCEE